MRKKNILTLILLGCASCLLISGCTKKEKTTTEETTNQEQTTNDVLQEVKLSKYVKLGEYKGIEVNAKIQDVTDEDIESTIQTALQKNPISKKGKAKTGDTVVLDYTGTYKGETVPGAEAKGVAQIVGADFYIDGVADKLKGVKKGDTFTVKSKLTDAIFGDYVGKKATFTFTVKDVQKTLSEPTDAWVKKYVDGCSTVEEYKASIREDLEKQNKEKAEQEAKQEAWDTVMKNSTIHEYPETILAIGEQMYDDLLKRYADTANTDEDGYLETIGVSKEENKKKREEYAKDIAKRIMVCNAICEKEGFEVGDEGYQEELKAMEEKNSMTEEQLVTDYGEDELEQSVQMNRVVALIMAEMKK